MNQYITDVVATKTDDELYTFIENREKYLPETVLASVNELQSRGVEFGQDELDVIEQDMRARAELALDEPGQSLFATNGWKYKLVDDDFAPRYFSQLVVFLFSVFAGAFFGSILMAINIGKSANRGKAISVAFYGLLFEILQSFFLQGSIVGLIMVLITKVLGGFILTSYFWNAYLGNGTLYKARPFWVPLIIAILFFAINLWSVKYLLKSGLLKN